MSRKEKSSLKGLLLKDKQIFRFITEMSFLDVYCRKTVFNLITRRKHSKDYAVLSSDVRLGKVFMSCCLLLFYVSSIYL